MVYGDPSQVRYNQAGSTMPAQVDPIRPDLRDVQGVLAPGAKGRGGRRRDARQVRSAGPGQAGPVPAGGPRPWRWSASGWRPPLGRYAPLARVRPDLCRLAAPVPAAMAVECWTRPAWRPLGRYAPLAPVRPDLVPAGSCGRGGHGGGVRASHGHASGAIGVIRWPEDGDSARHTDRCGETGKAAGGGPRPRARGVTPACPALAASRGMIMPVRLSRQSVLPPLL